MTTLRHQIASLQPKKFALFFFPLDNSLEPCKTLCIKEGAVHAGTMVRLYWDKKNPDLPAKIIFLEGMGLYTCCMYIIVFWHTDASVAK